MATEKSKLIFINLGIDALWEDSPLLDMVLPIRSPANQELLGLYQTLGVYLTSSKNDTVLVQHEPDAGFLEFLRDHQIATPLWIVVPVSLAQTSDWLLVFKDLIAKIAPQTFTACEFSGHSKVEIEILKTLAQHGRPIATLSAKPVDARTLQVQKDLNRKRTLLRLASQAQIDFPPSLLVKFSERARWQVPFDPPYLLKIDQSSGGQGIFDVPDLQNRILPFLEGAAQRAQNDVEWILQKKFQKQMDFYSVGDQGAQPTLFQLFYGADNSSWRHLSLTSKFESLRSKLSDTFASLSSLVAAAGYHGPFGLDGILTDGGVLYPALDLNARLDKSRCITKAAQRFGISDREIDAQKLRLVCRTRRPFEEYWPEITRELGLDEKGEKKNGEYLFPYVVTPLKPDSVHNGPQILDLCYFSGRRGHRPEAELTQWQNSITLTIKRTLER